MTSSPDTLTKFEPEFSCPKCGSDKASVRFEPLADLAEERARRKRLHWPENGELIVRGCQVCSFTTIYRPLDWKEPSNA